MKMLIMGLPGAGKTYFAKRLQKHLNCAWYNADEMRRMSNDWDFTKDGRKRQAARMKTIADFESRFGRTVICDFVCPTRLTRKSFAPDVVIWMDTIKEGRFEDTNKMFEEPNKYDYRIERLFTDKEIEELGLTIRNQMRNEGKL